jgi:hypothetical protein
LTITKVAGGVQISWTGTGTLQASSGATGPFTNLTGVASSPVILAPTATQSFYRVKD